MALNPGTKYPGRITAPDANYTYGSSKDETAPGAGDGTPYELARANDIFGLQQALLLSAGIVPSGNSETQLVSQYLQSIIELAMGRATNYDDSGVADAYVLDVQTDQQAPASLFDGMIAEFIVGNTNAGASTVNLATLGVKNIIGTSSGGELTAGERVKVRYRTSSGDFEIVVAPALATAGSLFGLGLSNGTDANNDIDIATGEAADSTNAFTMVLSSILVKQLDAAWAVGTAAGGLFTGAKAADTWYHVFEIRKTSDGTTDAGFDTSVTAANIPAGYSAYRRIGSILTDGTSNILGFSQEKNYFEWDAVIQDSSGVPATVATNITLSTPLGVVVKAHIFVNATNVTTSGSAPSYLISNPATTDKVPSNTLGQIGSVRANATSSGGITLTEVSVYTNTSSQVRTRASQSGIDSVTLTTFGWVDSRGSLG